MFDKYNTDGYTAEEINALNDELETRLAGIDDTDRRSEIEKNFSDEVSHR
jgi:hypothetical protein